METKMKKESAIAIGAVIILILSLIGTGVYFNANKSLKADLNNEKLKSEMMLSEELALNKELNSLKIQINVLSGRNKDLDKILEQTRIKLSEKEVEIGKVSRENGNIKSLRRQLAELTKLKNDLDSQVLALSESTQKLIIEKDELNKTIASLKDENKQLTANLAILSSITADNYLVETTKRKDRLTVNAKRTHKMAVSFKVPSNMVESISFKITKPDGTQVQGKDQGIAFTTVNDDENLLASTSNDEITVSKKIEMTYQPKEKLKAGIYKIEMLNGEKYIGSCNVRLR
jgi:hypothetical protein